MSWNLLIFFTNELVTCLKEITLYITCASGRLSVLLHLLEMYTLCKLCKNAQISYFVHFTSELRVRLAAWTGFSPPVKYFTDRSKTILCLLCLCARLFICGLWSPAGKGLTSWLSFVVSIVSHWYPGSGVVLDCIDTWSLHPYLLRLATV